MGAAETSFNDENRRGKFILALLESSFEDDASGGTATSNLPKPALPVLTPFFLLLNRVPTKGVEGGDEQKQAAARPQEAAAAAAAAADEAQHAVKAIIAATYISLLARPRQGLVGFLLDLLLLVVAVAAAMVQSATT